MRVIAGTARSLPLKTIEGLDTRPTTDRIKETLFNMLQADIPGCRFLDLFAGSGGIGIEALSRGAKEAVFVENNQRAVSCIRENLAFTHLADRARVMAGDAASSVLRLSSEEPFDIIFMDPPYHLGAEREVLQALDSAGIVDEYTLIVVEAALDTDFSWLAQTGFRIRKEKKYKTNRHLFLERMRPHDNSSISREL